MSPTKKYFVYLFLVVLGFELMVTFGSGVFGNLTDRVKMKAAMVNHRDQTDVLFIGTSRFKDGIVPSIVTEKINTSSSVDWSGFNGATTGTNLKRLQYFFNTTIAAKNLKLVVIEVSKPHFGRTPLGFDEPDTLVDFENELQNALANTSNAVQYRKSFRVQNLPNIVAIVGANHFEGSEWYRAGGLKDFVSDDTDLSASEPWSYELLTPTDSTISLDNTEFIEVYQTIVDSARAHNIELAFVVPPLAVARQKRERQESCLNLYQAIANETGCSILDYSKEIHSDELFYDQNSHLNKEGRSLFSNQLGSDLTQLMKERNVIQ